MSWQSTSVRYVSIGERSARFRDLTLPFNAAGEPVETVIWLPNGGGKSSLMSLMSAVVLPAARDFTGAGREDGEKRPRRLDDYVGSGDTSHTVIEWTTDEPGQLTGATRLLTGAVYEWPERRRPGPDSDVRLNKIWWSAVPLPEVFDIALLPVRDGRLQTLAQFREHLRELNAEFPELQIQIATTQAQWEEQLERLRIDTALYRYQARMNTSEGGIAKVFNFNTVRDFIDLVVDVIASPEQAADCGSILGRYAQGLFRRPALATEQTFLSEAGDILEDLAVVHDEVTAAVAAQGAARRSAAELRGGLGQAATLRETAARVADEEHSSLASQASEARRERGRTEGLRAKVGVRVATLRHQVAVQDLQQAKESRDAADRTHREWAAAAPLAEAIAHDADAEELRLQLAPERAEREEIRRRLDVYAAATTELHAQVADGLDGRAAAAETAATGRAGTVDRLSGDLRTFHGSATEQHRAMAAVEARLDEHDRALGSARKQGVLGASESPKDAHSRHESASRRAATRAADQDAAEAEADAEYREAAEAVTELAGEHSRLVGEAEHAEQGVVTLRTAHDAIVTHERFIALSEADSPRVWGDAPRVRHALADAAREFDEQALREAVAAADDDRLVAGVEATGLLPPPAATRQAADDLTAAGIPAEPAWDLLSRTYTEADRAAAAEATPDVVSGVVVQDDGARSRGLVLLASSPALSLIPVVTAAEVDAVARPAGDATRTPIVAVPLHAGLHAPAAATAAADRLRTQGSERAGRQTALRERAAADRALLTQISDFLAMWPGEDSLTLAEQVRDDLRSKADTTHAARRAREEVRDAARSRAADAKKLAGEARREESSHTQLARRAEQLAAAEERMAEHRSASAHAAAELERIENRVREVTADLAAAQEAQRRSEREAADLRREAAAERDRAREVTAVDPDAVPDAGEVAEAAGRGLGECRATYLRLRAQWTEATSSSVLEAKLGAVEENAAAARRRADGLLDGAGAGRSEVALAAATLAVAHTTEACLREAQQADSAKVDAIGALSRAESVRDAAATELNAAQSRFTSAQRVPDPVDHLSLEDAVAQEEQLGVRVSTLTSTESQLINERDEAEKRAARERHLAESLADLADRLPVPEAVDAASAAQTDAFLGDLAEARVAVKHAESQLEGTQQEVAAGQQLRADLANQALKLATNPVYADLQLTLRDRLADGDAAGLAAKARRYGEEVAVRHLTVTDWLAQIAADELRIGQVVASHVRQLLRGIDGAARASILPPGLGDLSGQKFINLRFAAPNDEELLSRVSQEILAMLDSAHGQTKSLPSGETVLRRCVHAAVGQRGFRVDVLKPNEHMLAQRVQVTDVARFSDGEKLTTCVLLYCAFARMRQQGRTGGATGTLMLDNPFGRASNAQLVALQLAVAKAQRVHLVYATGLEDMGALLQFRCLIRLRNRKPVGTTDGHVQLESQTSGARIGEVTGVSVSRPTAPVPAELATPTQPAEDDEDDAAADPDLGGSS